MTDVKIDPYTHHIPVRIYWENTDAGGRVYHTQYIQFAERGRTEWLRQKMGINQTQIIANTGLIFVVKSLTTDFFGYAELDDEVVVATCVQSVKGAKMVFYQDIFKGDMVIVRLQVIVVCVGKNGVPVRIPKYIIDKFNNIV